MMTAKERHQYMKRWRKKNPVYSRDHMRRTRANKPASRWRQIVNRYLHQDVWAKT